MKIAGATSNMPLFSWIHGDLFMENFTIYFTKCFQQIQLMLAQVFVENQLMKYKIVSGNCFISLQR